MKKTYKALMLDVDGTIVENNNMEGLPSERVRTAIKKAQEKLHVGLVTSRPLFSSKYIFDSLKLSGPCIVQGGAQIIDGETQKVLSEHALPREVILQANDIAKKYNIILSFNGHESYFQISGKFPSRKKSYGIITLPPIEKKIAKLFFRELKDIPELAVFTSPSKDEENEEFVFGTHASATKQHGILEVAKILNINTHEIIGVGDGYNDFPMMMACGLKVAMGNAEPDLKAIADYIAPSVDEDGVAEVIEKFVL
jgi:Cof subfamily protein (haloacid dehalogenase superfamily)